MANEITKTIWGGLISNADLVTGVTAMRQHAIAELNGTPEQVNSTDISRASAVGVALTNAVPSTDAKTSLTTSAGSLNLTTTLDTFLDTYSKIRVFTYLFRWTSWDEGNNAANQRDPYTRTGYKNSPAVTTPSDTAPGTAYDNLQDLDAIDLSNYQSVITTLNGVITTNSNKSDSNITYCHSSCHDNCHSSRGRR